MQRRSSIWGQGRSLTAGRSTRRFSKKRLRRRIALPSRKSAPDHAAVNGRKNAAEIIEAVARGAAKGKVKASLPTKSEQ